MKNPVNLRLYLAGFSLLLLSACSDGGYYLQAARGQYDILKKSQPIDKMLETGTLPQQQQLELARILQIRNFASEHLGLPDNGSYRSYVELDRPYPVWNLVAAPEFSLTAKTWCFPIAGCISYRGYFSEADATQLANKFRLDGYDTLVAGVPAYSTLSWFDDPVLSSFSSWPTPSVARLIFHELAHQELYLAGDSDFSEAFATSVELAGIDRWLTANGSTEERNLFQRQLQRETAFIAWANNLHKQLAQLYATSIPDPEKRQRKAEIITIARNSYQELKTTWGGYKGYDKWVKTLNNARLVSLQTYRRLLPAFNELLVKHNNDLEEFYKACRELSELPHEQRSQRLIELLTTPNLATGQ